MVAATRAVSRPGGYTNSCSRGYNSERRGEPKRLTWSEKQAKKERSDEAEEFEAMKHEKLRRQAREEEGAKRTGGVKEDKQKGKGRKDEE